VSLYRFGQIVMAWIQDGKGGTKERPAIIISNDEQCKSDAALLVIAISTSIKLPLPDYHFIVHDSHDHDGITGLSRPSVAKCDWVREIPRQRIIKSLGCVPDDLLDAIVRRYDSLQEDLDFDDWQ
jgi:mRNA-degrading endonuclease toxin of MazEF toxin-antitoxin module